MGSINWVGDTALVGLALALPAGTAVAQKDASGMNRISIDARAKDRFQEEMRATQADDGQSRIKIRSGRLEWETGGFEMKGERRRTGSKLMDAFRLGTRWQRTYAADVRAWASPTTGFDIEAGARLERTNRGVAGGPLLTRSTKFVARTVFVGAQISDTSSIRLLAFDDGGWSEGAIGELVTRTVNGEPTARQGTAIEIGRSPLQSENVRRIPEFKVRLSRGHAGASSDTSATVSYRVRL